MALVWFGLALHTKPEKLKSVRFSSGVNPNPKPTCPRILGASGHAWPLALRILGASGHAWPLAPEFSRQVVMHGELPLGGPPKGHPEAKHTEPKKLKSVRFSSGVNPNSNVNKVCPPPSPISGPPKQHSEAKHTKPEKLKSVRFSSGVNPNPKPTCPRILGASGHAWPLALRILGASGHAWPLAPEFSRQVVMHGELPLGGPPKGHPEAKHTEPKKLKSVRFSSGVNPNPNVNKLCSHPPPSQGHPKSIQKQSTQSQRSSNPCGFQAV